MSTASPQSLYNPEIECNALSILLRAGPAVWGDFHLNDRMDVSSPHRPLWDVIALQLNATPNGSLDPLLLSTKLAGMGITQMEGGFEVFAYLEGLTNRFVETSKAGEYARELKRLRVRRDLIVETEATKRKLIESPNASFEEMTNVMEQGLTKVTTAYHQGEQFENVFGPEFVRVHEERCANPIKAEDMGWMGPFPTINRTLGALSAPGLFVTVGARTGNSKSALGFYHNVWLAERHNLPVLLLDCGEMTIARIRDRAVCALSMGRIPLWAVKSGEWGANKEWRTIMHEDIYPRVAKLRVDFRNIGNLSPKEKVRTIRRYYYQHVGRGNQLLILDDYLKGVEAIGKNSAEHQAVGYYVNDIKDLITTEIQASFWTSVQNNRTGSYQGKKAADITDSEDQMGLSDRIIQQSDWGFILRFKVPEELAKERGLFGNMKLTPCKTREALGKDYERALRPIKVGSRFVGNYFHLDNKVFSFAEKGDLKASLEVLGEAAIDMATPKPEGDKPQTGI